MRKFLSLVLALVMMMSLVTINAGAKEFSDDGDITYKEAVDVISAIHVVDGYSNGSFNPGGNLTRGAAAKIICNMVLGPTTASQLHANTAPFRDVPAGHDFAGYIAFCQKEGIISGYPDGSFRPAGTLTGNAFMKMLLGALGYDAEIEQYVGPNWTVKVAKQAIGIGLTSSLEGAFDGGKFITREEAALYAFNTLRSDLVEYGQRITTTVNGAEVTLGNSLAKAQSWNNSLTRHDNIRNDDYIQFAEQYFNKLVLTESEDCFGRPDREWKYDGDEIGAYINYDLFKEEYTTKVTGKDLRDLLGNTVVNDYSFEITVDGETAESVLGSAYFTQGNLVRTNTEKVGETGNGVLTQVFVDNDKEVEHVWIAIINTYLAKANSDYNSKKDEVTYNVWHLTDDGHKDQLVKADEKKINLTVDGEDFDIEDVKEDDIALVHVAEGEIKEFIDPETVDNTELTAFKKGDWIKADGDQYDYADTILYDDEVLDNYDEVNMKDTTYRVYLDEYGYAIGIEIIDAVDQYAFLTGIDGNGSHLTNKYADGKLIFTDGTVETARINMEDSEALNPKFKDGTTTSSNEPFISFSEAALWNTWCTYTVDSNGVYTLTQVADNQAHFESNDSGNAYTGTRKHDKVGQGRDYDDGVTLSTDDYIRTLDKKRVGLNGVPGTGYTSVYGNDDTVYLTAETKYITDAVYGKPTVPSVRNIIIDGVDSVSTGIQNIDLDVFSIKKITSDTDALLTAGTDNNVANGVYTLFKDNGYAIAAIVIGEDNGSTSKYAYVTSESNKDGLSQEEWNKSDDEWKWTREAIVDGELVDLVEVGDSLSKDGIRDMQRNHWYEVKYKADGTVRRVLEIESDSDTAPHSTTDRVFCKNQTAHGMYPKYAGLIEYVDALNGKNNENSLTKNDGTVILFEDMREQGYELDANGNTLMVTNQTNEAKGFAVSANAKVVLVQDVLPSNSTDPKEMDYIETYTSGQSALKQAIDYLNDDDNDGKFFGYLSAVFENGLATSVVIYDKTPTSIDQGNGNIGGGDNDGILNDVTINVNTLEITANTVNDSSYSKAAISRVLNGRGFSVTGWGSTYVDAVKDGTHYTFTIETDDYYTVEVDGKVVDTVLSGNDSSKTWGSVKSKTGTGYQIGGVYYAYGADTALIASNVTAAVVIKTGYVAVAAPAAVSATPVKGLTAASFALDNPNLTTTGVKTGETIDYVITYSGTASDDATITFTAGANSTAAGEATVTVANATVVPAGTTATFQATAGTADVGAASVAIA